MFRRVGTLSFSRLPFAEWEGFYHTVPYSAELEHFHRRFIKNGDLSRRLRATLPEGESFSSLGACAPLSPKGKAFPPSWNTFIQPASFCRAGRLPAITFKFAALHILYNCFTDFSLLNNFSGCIM